MISFSLLLFFWPKESYTIDLLCIYLGLSVCFVCIITLTVHWTRLYWLRNLIKSTKRLPYNSIKWWWIYNVFDWNWAGDDQQKKRFVWKTDVFHLHCDALQPVYSLIGRLLLHFVWWHAWRGLFKFGTQRNTCSAPFVHPNNHNFPSFYHFYKLTWMNAFNFQQNILFFF